MILDFDSARLLAQIGALTPRMRTLFAAAAAERTFHGYHEHHARTGDGDPDALRNALDALWAALLTSDFSKLTPELEERIVALAPAYDPDVSVSSYAAADDAVAAIAYAIESGRTGESQPAAWAAARAIASLDQRAIDELQLDMGEPHARETLLRHPLVQNELQQQRRDLNELATVSEQDFATRVPAFRERAKEAR